MSMAVIMGLMGYALLFIGGCDTKQMLLLAVVFAALFALLAVIEPYRMARLTSFVDPWADALGDGYQLIQSYYALGSGGLFGVGLNNSHQKLLYMTYGESDFIFAIVCEELGLVGGLLVLAAYGFIIYRGIRIALLCRDRFGSMLAGGITVVFGLQVFVNIGVCTGLLPTTGQALPFISAGGSSMMIFLAAMGVLLNISRFNNQRD
ncbi:MAG TPA: FtsW/RodA/SpoVE family cell cycle protein, partial [Eubacteriales bacterium]|nr:FtsW/RodA/SpoVE family cell cycle protein [Eubacteriales bacterium]